jgi:hypothetical protein
MKKSEEEGTIKNSPIYLVLKIRSGGILKEWRVHLGNTSDTSLTEAGWMAKKVLASVLDDGVGFKPTLLYNLEDASLQYPGEADVPLSVFCYCYGRG